MLMKDVLTTNPDALKRLCKGVDKILQPLSESFDITFFSYKRIAPDGEFIFLTNHYPWLAHIIEEQYIQYLNSFAIKQDKILWDGINANEKVYAIMQDARDNYNIAHGITLVKEYNNCVEHFNFATTRDNTNINNFYLNSMSLLDRFIIYFREKAARMIKVVENYSVNLKDIYLIKRAVNKQEFYSDIDYFIEQTNIKVIHLEVDSKDIEVNYTLARSGYLLTQGNSYKKIAKIMYVSLKTVEARLAKLRALLNVANKKELITLFSDNKIRKTLELSFNPKR